MKPDVGGRLLFFLMAAFAVSGCWSRSPAELNEAALIELGELPGATQSVSQPLRDELARIREEGGLPTQLTRSNVTESDNLSLILTQLFQAESLPELVARVDEAFPGERFTFSPIALEKAIRLRRSYDKQLVAIADSLKSPQRVFVVDYRQGFFADRSFIDACRVAVTLETYRVAEQLVENRPTDALPSLRMMFDLTQRLAALQHVEARLEAVELRSRAFQVLQAVVDHPQFSADDLASIRPLVHQQLTHWPPDHAAWIGDRAVGLHAYELVRRGELLQLLTADEVAQFTKEGTLADLHNAARRIVDQDELYYLQTMRTLIDACQKPYVQREPIFGEILQAQHERRYEPDFPLVAARVFLPNIEQAQRLQAEDRALVEIWALALSLAAGNARQSERLDPASGKPYRVSLGTNRVTVSAESLPGRSALVPVLAAP